MDIATIPFHLSFQQLVELYGANDAALATFISRFQTRAASSGRYETLSSEERKILQGAGLTLSKLGDSRRAFNQINSEKLKNRAKVLLRVGRDQPIARIQGRLDLIWIFKPVVLLKTYQP